MHVGYPVPRTIANELNPVEHLSVLNEEGELDSELRPDLDDKQLKEMYYKMLLSRRFDERLLSLQRQGRLGTFALVKGQEASQIGAVAALEDSDWMVPSYRETAASLWRGLPLQGLILYNAGYNEGGHVPERHRDLPISIPVASQLLHAAGLAYGLRLLEEPDIVLAFFGDGATSEGDFHEALNFASVFSCPVVFVCQNNQYAISVPRSQQTRSKTLAQKAAAYAVPYLQVDGNDVLAVYAGVRQAVERARADENPSLIECVTYRLSMHTTVDDPRKYRDDSEVEEWEKREPLIRTRDYLLRQEVLTEEEIDEWESQIESQIAKAVKDAFNQMEELDDPAVMFDHIYETPTKQLRRQRRAFETMQRGRKATAKTESQKRGQSNGKSRGDAHEHA